MTTQESFVDSVDQGQIAENVQSGLRSTLEVEVHFSQGKSTINLLGSESFELNTINGNQGIFYNSHPQFPSSIIFVSVPFWKPTQCLG